MTHRTLALVIAAFVAFLPEASYARLICSTATTSANTGNCYVATTNPPTADIMAVGGLLQGGIPKTFSEVVIDYTGSLYPTSTLGTQTIGTSALPFSNVYSVGATITGSETSGTVGVTPASGVGGTAATQSIVSGIAVFGKTALTGIVVSSAIPVNSSYETVMSTASASIILSATPTVSTTTVINGTVELPSGTYLVLSSTGASGVTVTDEGTLTGSRLQLGAATRVITQFKTLTLIYDATDHFWREISYGNN